jgi:uroporphyrinogen-III synthase
VSFPTLTISPIELPASERQKVLDLDHYQCVICISANAAHLGMEHIHDYWPQMPVQQTWLAVGPATAEALGQWHIHAICPEKAPHSEGMLALPELCHVRDQKILILRGRGGRDTLADNLRTRGAKVDYLELYERSLPTVDLNILQNWLDETGTSGQNSQTEPALFRPVITATSSESLKNLRQLAGATATQLTARPLVVPSERLAEFAYAQGFHTIWVAKGATEEALIDCLKVHAL